MLLGSDTEAGLVLVMGKRGFTMADGQQLLAAPMPLDWATVLQPVGAPTKRGSVLSQRYTLGAGLIGHARLRVFETTAILFVATGPEAETARVERLVETLLASAREERAAAPTTAAAGSRSGSLAKALAAARSTT